MTDKLFYQATDKRIEHKLGMPHLYVWLTPDQANGFTDQNQMVDIFEDRNGEMVWMPMCISDLNIIGEDFEIHAKR